MGHASHQGDPSAAMLEVLDPVSNCPLPQFTLVLSPLPMFAHNGSRALLTGAKLVFRRSLPRRTVSRLNSHG